MKEWESDIRAEIKDEQRETLRREIKKDVLFAEHDSLRAKLLADLKREMRWDMEKAEQQVALESRVPKRYTGDSQLRRVGCKRTRPGDHIRLRRK